MKLLIANRGEIAVRVTRTARDLGYEVVAVYSEADAESPHVHGADEAVCIGPGPATDSYLAVDKIIDACRKTGATTVHPGYGFLAENAAFAEACAGAGLRFVGPSPAAIRLMGDKVEAKREMSKAGVPTLPGYLGEDQAEATLVAQAQKIGTPLLVKAVAGGGGRGMRLVHDLSKLPDALRSARSEATSAFGRGDLFLERLLEGARHVEIQVFADSHGGAIHLGERECSVQRRHQKVIEEAPSPAVDDTLRAAMGASAVAAAKAIDYVGAGTVEFLLDNDGNFYFLEMNTRLQVEHPVTEMVTGLDLVAWQLLVAEGQPLPRTQDAVEMLGHAIEARLYAEDPYAGFLPQAGSVAVWAPAAGNGVRVDSGIAPGLEVSPYYDPMVAKVVAHASTRDLARRRLIAALRDTQILGLRTNRGFLVELLASHDFAAWRIKTDTIDRQYAEPRPPEPADAVWAVAAVLRGAGFDAWRSTGSLTWPVTLEHRDLTRELRVTAHGGARYTVEGGGGAVLVELEEGAARLDGVRRRLRWIIDGDTVHLHTPDHAFGFREPPPAQPGAADESRAAVVAPMAGRVLALEVSVGDPVERGQCIAVVEAMKIEHRVQAGAAGVVEAVQVAVGDQVTARQPIARVQPRE